MSFPSGGPGTGGFPGQGPQQPQQQFPGPPAPPAGGGGMKISLPQILFLATAGLGLLNLFFGFINVTTGTSFYEQPAVTWIPTLLFVAGLAALPTVLPGDQKAGIWPALISLGVTLPFLFITFASNMEYAAGGIIVLIFAFIQTLVAVAAYLLEENIIKPPQPQPQPMGQPGQFGQPGQPGQFGQQGPQPGAFGQPGQPGQQGQPGQSPQPVNPHHQPTAYASQQGQFFQPHESGQQTQSGQQGPQQGS